MRYMFLITILLVGCSGSREPVADVESEGVVDQEFDLDDGFKQFLEDFKNRKIYKTLDVETLKAIPDDDVELAVVDYVDHKLESGEDEQAALETLSEGARAMWLTWIVDGEVNNGGFNQYYWNTEDEYSSQDAEAFDFFSATEHAKLMREANTIRAKETEEIKQLKDENTLEAFSESYKVSKLGPLDKRYYALEEDLSALRIAKIRQDPELFIGD